jgi:hypothetical protein
MRAYRGAPDGLDGALGVFGPAQLVECIITSRRLGVDQDVRG